MNKNLKTIFIILIILLISIISFFGIYQKENFQYTNKIPKYQYTKSLSKTVIANLKIDETTEEVTYDENGKVVESTGEETENSEENTNYTTKEEPVNPEEVRTVENYKLCKEIIEKRLKDIGLPEYFVRLDEKTGNIQIEFEQDANVEAGIYYASYVGKAEFLDENEQVKLDNSDIQKVEVGYTQNTSGAYQVYLTVTLNKQGQEKINNMKSEIDQTSQEVNNTVETANIAEESATVETSNTVEESSTSESTEKTLSFQFEEEEIGTVNINDIANNKSIRVNIESASSNTSTVNSYLNEGAVIAILINSGRMPIQYEIDNSQEFVTEISKTEQNIIIYVLIGILVIVALYEIIRYRKDGFAVAISNIAIVAIFLLLLRYTNVAIGYETFFICFILEIALIYFHSKILSKLKNITEKETAQEALKQVYKESVDILFLLLLVAVVFTFINWTEIATMGMVMFWGIISIFITHFVFTRTLLFNHREK